MNNIINVRTEQTLDNSETIVTQEINLKSPLLLALKRLGKVMLYSAIGGGLSSLYFTFTSSPEIVQGIFKEYKIPLGIFILSQAAVAGVWKWWEGSKWAKEIKNYDKN